MPMAKQDQPQSTPKSKPKPSGARIRAPAEVTYARELRALAQNDTHDKPAGWQLSPRMVEKYVLGGDAVPYEDPATHEKTDLTITPKFIGDRLLVQKALVSLMSDRALLLIGPPGTAKSWLSEHLVAAISGDSTRVIQGTAGTTEDQVKYSWNYALLIAKGPSWESIVSSPLLACLQAGKIVRFEELTRVPQEIQDTLISILSEKNVVVPELGETVYATKGFNVIATANTLDKGINEMSAALKRRFNFVRVRRLASLKEEMRVVETRTRQLLEDNDVTVPLDQDLIELLVTTFMELRAGSSLAGDVKVRSPSTAMSTAEEISVLYNSALTARSFGKATAGIAPKHLVMSFEGTLIKDKEEDVEVLREYFAKVVKRRQGSLWRRFYDARKYLY